MSPQPEEDWEQRLHKLEAEMKSSSVEFPQPEAQRQKSPFGFSSFNSQALQLQSWFNSLSRARQLVVLGVTALIGWAILQAVLKLLASIISLALLAVLVYVGYKFFVSSSFQNKK